MDDASLMDFQPGLPIRDPAVIAEARSRTEWDWFHKVQLGDFLTPGFGFEVNWRFVARYLQKHAALFEGAEVLETGCADGLWTGWFTRLGARRIVATDIADRDQFRLVARAFDLPVEYVPNVLSTLLPLHVRQQFDVVASLGLLYHVHDPLTTLAMYRRYLKEDGVLVLETATSDSDAAYMQYTGSGQVYGKQGGNQFLQSRGFILSALDELGMDVLDFEYRSDGMTDQLGADVGRAVYVAKKTRRVEMHYYSSVLEQLGMLGEPFSGEAWYHMTI